MLKIFRKKSVAKFVLWSILILILPAFVLWGTGNIGKSGKKGPSYAGTIDGKKVSFDRFGHALVGARCQIILSFYHQPKIMDEFLSNKELMGKMAWDRLIMENEARKSGMKAENADVVAFIKSHPIFSRNGQFDPRVYDYVLQRVPIDPRSFEEIVRENIFIQKLNDSIAKDIAVSDEEASELFGKESERFKISYTFFPLEDFLGKAKPDEASVKGYYDAHAKDFVVPEKVMEDGTVSGGQVAGFEDVKTTIEEFLTALEARKLAMKYAETERTAIKTLVDKDGVPFEKAVEARKLKPSETTFFARGDRLDTLGEAMPIAEAASKLKALEISSPVETRNGIVIFRVVEVQKPDAKEFESKKGDYIAKARATKKLAQLEKWLRGMEEKNAALIDFRDYERYYR